MKYASVVAVLVGAASTTDLRMLQDNMGPPGEDGEKEYDQSLEVNTGRTAGEFGLEVDNDYYAGKVSSSNYINRGDDYTWEYKRSSAVALLGSTLSMASFALYMA